MGTTGQSITLANSIIGVGILAMPFCFQQCGVLLATLILILMGLVSRLCCYFLLKSALLARRRNFEFLAFHVFGSAGKFAVEVGIIGFLMGTCIAYFVVVGDLGPQIVSKMFNINQSDMLRTSIMVIVSLVCVLPLGLLRNVDSLSNVSAATIGFYFCLVMKVIWEAAWVLAGGPWSARVEMWRPAGVLQCVPIFSMALFCQTQLFEIFESLPSLSLEKMNLVTKNAINICTGVYFTLGLFGYIAFNTQEISGNILMSLSPTMASDVIKLGFVMSLAFSFPLIIFPCRASLYSLLYKKVHSSHHDHIIHHSIPEGSFRRITVGIVACTLGVSLLLPNIELVLGLLGSTIGVLICVVFPAACFLHLTFKDTNERLLAKGILILGLIIMVLGTYANLQAAENQVDKYDDKYITKERIDKIVEDFFENMEKNNGEKLKQEVNGNNKEDTNKLNGNIIKESVVLPPNPVPPESQSNEKNEHNENAIKNIPIIKEVLPNPIKDTIDKVSETHPKNLNKGVDLKTVNGEKNENINQEGKKTQNDDTKTKEDIKPQANEEKINIIKQQQLIETIKQHGEEQKELIKEQKEILHEIYKTKQELEKNKNEAANEEAKKIAVESIKKIANIALQSLAGVSEKPGPVNEEKKSEVLEKLADEAAQVIAQKAKETIEAMKEIQVKPEGPIKLPNLPVLPNNIPSNNENPSVNNNAAVNSQNVPNNLPGPAPQGTHLNNNPASLQNNNPNIDNSLGIQSNINANQQPNVQPPVVNIPQPIQSGSQLNNQVAPNIVQSAQNVAPPAHNIAAVAQNIAPVAQNIAPVAQNIAPVAQNIAPVAQNIAPVAQNMAPVAQNMAPVAQNIAPVAQNIAPAAQNVQPPQNILPAAQNVQPAQNVVQPTQNVVQPAQNIAPAAQNIPVVQNIAPAAQNNAPVAQIQAVNNDQVISNKVQEATNVEAAQPQPAVNIPEPSHIVKRVAPDVNIAQPEANVQNSQSNVQTNQVPNDVVQNQNQQLVQNVKEHSHSPDEPQSYKLGEDSQKNNIQQVPINNVIDQNIPLPIAMNGNSQNNNQQNNIPNIEELNKDAFNNIQNNIEVEDQKVADPGLIRQKREVVDCTEKSVLKPEDKEICKALIDPPIKIVENGVNDILSSKVNLNDAGLPHLPMPANVLHHLSRSLKSIEQSDKKR